MLYLNHLGLICALGYRHADIKHQLFNGQSGIRFTDNYSEGRLLPLGCLPIQNNDEVFTLASMDTLPIRLRSRNNQLALAAAEQLRATINVMIEQYGPHRIGIVIGTSTSGIAEGEAAFKQHAHTGSFTAEFHYGQQELGSPAEVLAKALGIEGPAYVHSSACASSGKAMASAARLIKMGVCDAVLTGGVDSLCAFTVSGFSALESLSSELCNPFSVNRKGINIGEGAALFIMSKIPASVALYGWGESNDAYHFSAPDPQGEGAKIAITQALARANIEPTQVDYINLHGTATLQNDAMESRVVHHLFGHQVPVSSTKVLTGHTLGAASAIEAGLCWLAMQDDNDTGRLLPHLWDEMPDPALPSLKMVSKNTCLGRPLRWVLSNSFAFGGSNVALVLGRA